MCLFMNESVGTGWVGEGERGGGGGGEQTRVTWARLSNFCFYSNSVTHISLSTWPLLCLQSGTKPILSPAATSDHGSLCRGSSSEPLS